MAKNIGFSDNNFFVDKQIQADWAQNDKTKDDYIKNKAEGAAAQSDWAEDDIESAAFIRNKPDYDLALNDLQKAILEIKDKNDDTIHLQPDWLEEDDTSPAFIFNKPDIDKILEERVKQSDWAEEDDASPAFIKNKPNIERILEEGGDKRYALRKYYENDSIFIGLKDLDNKTNIYNSAFIGSNNEVTDGSIVSSTIIGVDHKLKGVHESVIIGYKNECIKGDINYSAMIGYQNELTNDSMSYSAVIGQGNTIGNMYGSLVVGEGHIVTSSNHDNLIYGGNNKLQEGHATYSLIGGHNNTILEHGNVLYSAILSEHSKYYEVDSGSITFGDYINASQGRILHSLVGADSCAINGYVNTSIIQGQEYVISSGYWLTISMLSSSKINHIDNSIIYASQCEGNSIQYSMALLRNSVIAAAHVVTDWFGYSRDYTITQGECVFGYISSGYYNKRPISLQNSLIYLNNSDYPDTLAISNSTFSVNKFSAAASSAETSLISIDTSVIIGYDVALPESCTNLYNKVFLGTRPRIFSDSAIIINNGGGPYNTFEINNDYSTYIGSNALANRSATSLSYSFIYGAQNVIWSSNTLIFGNQNTINSIAYVFGNNNVNPTNNSTGQLYCYGSNNLFMGTQNFIAGFNNQVYKSELTNVYVLGNYLLAGSNNQVILGSGNIPDEDNKYQLILGGGTNSSRKNLLTCSRTGDLEVLGDIIDGTGHKLSDLYSFDGGIQLNADGRTIEHINILSEDDFSNDTAKLSFGDNIDVPMNEYDDNGHITAQKITTYTLPTIDEIQYNDSSTLLETIQDLIDRITVLEQNNKQEELEPPTEEGVSV